MTIAELRAALFAAYAEIEHLRRALGALRQPAPAGGEARP